MKTLVTLKNDWLRTAGCLVLLTALLGCDAKSTEIGATAAAGSSGGEETSGGVSESSAGPATGCAAAVDAESCAAVDVGQDFCAWVEVQTTDATCGLDSDPVGRCISSTFYGDGCVTPVSCVDDTSVYTRALGGGQFEWFSFPTQCGYDLPGYSECWYDGSDDAPCECLCQGLGGIGSLDCDPLNGPDCPGGVTPQECVPNLQNDGWECVPQEGDAAPGYGDECSLESPRDFACVGATACFPPEGLGVAGCDGADGSGCCTQLCSMSAKDNPCPDNGQMCSSYYGDAEPPEGYEDLGICRIP